MKAKAVIKAFLERTIHGANPCGAISLHLANSKSEPLLKRKVSEIEIDAFVIEVGEIINDDDAASYCLKSWYLDLDENSLTVPGEVSRPIQIKSDDTGQALLVQMLKQSHEHIEVLMTQVATMVQASASTSNRQADAAARIIGELGDTRLRMIQAEQDVLDRSHERQLESKRDERNAQFLEAGVSGLIGILPMFAGQLTGILPQGAKAMRASPQYQAIKSLFADLPADQWPAVHEWLKFAPLPVAQKATLEMVIDSMMTDMIEAEKTNNGKVESPSGN